MKKGTREQIREVIEEILANDEASTDEELVAHFQTEMGLSEAEARAWVSRRNGYLRDVCPGSGSW